MKIQDKISKIAKWIVYESDDSFGEVENLLYTIYYSKFSGMSGNIDDDYESVLNYKKGE